MRRLLLLLTALVVLAAAPAAGAATATVIHGAGWGHGVGMSQWGAYGFAKRGFDYRHILAHYYQGTRLSEARTETIRVLLQATGAASFSGATRIPGQRELDPERSYRVRPAGRGVEVRSARGTLVGRFPAPLRVDSERGAPLRLGGRALNGVTRGTYRGALEFHRRGGSRGLLAVNAAGLDDYLQGVVPGEMPSSWHAEALKAQSVAARSYALTADVGGAAFDQYPDTRSQVYRGVVGEQARSNAAVRATAGEVLRHGGRIATTFFFSTSGGHTENVENVFYGAPRPYLKGVPDPYDHAAPRHRWTVRLSNGRMQARLGGLVKGRFREVRVLERGVSPRIVWAEVVGSRGSTRVRGATLRARLGLNDTWAYFSSVSIQAGASAAGSAPRGARVSSRAAATRTSWLGRLLRSRSVWGRVTPVPPQGIVIERRGRRGRWQRLRRAPTSRAGAYRVTVPGPGVYRVRGGGVTGPAVRVR